MSIYTRRTVKGEPFTTVPEFIDWILYRRVTGCYVYFRHKPINPSWSRSWPIGYIAHMIDYGGWLFKCYELDGVTPYQTPIAHYAKQVNRHIKHLSKQRELLLDAADAAILGGDLSL